MTNEERMAARDGMVTWIAKTEADPAQWMIVARALCGRLGLSAPRVLPLGQTLEIVCDAIVGEAMKHGLGAADVRRAFGT